MYTPPVKPPKLVAPVVTDPTVRRDVPKVRLVRGTKS